MPCRQQHHQGRAEHRLRLNLFGNPSTQEQVKSRHEGKVKLIGEQPVQLSLRVHAEQRNAHVRVTIFIDGQRLRQERSGEGAKLPNANGPGAGQTHVIPAPVKQRRPNLLFKVANLPA